MLTGCSVPVTVSGHSGGRRVADPVVADERMVGEGDRPLEFESVAKGDSMFRDLVLVRIVAAVKMSGLSRFGEKWRAAAS